MKESKEILDVQDLSDMASVGFEALESLNRYHTLINQDQDEKYLSSYSNQFLEIGLLDIKTRLGYPTQSRIRVSKESLVDHQVTKEIALETVKEVFDTTIKKLMEILRVIGNKISQFFMYIKEAIFGIKRKAEECNKMNIEPKALIFVDEGKNFDHGTITIKAEDENSHNEDQSTEPVHEEKEGNVKDHSVEEVTNKEEVIPRIEDRIELISLKKVGDLFQVFWHEKQRNVSTANPKMILNVMRDYHKDLTWYERYIDDLVEVISRTYTKEAEFSIALSKLRDIFIGSIEEGFRDGSDTRASSSNRKTYYNNIGTRISFDYTVLEPGTIRFPVEFNFLRPFEENNKGNVFMVEICNEEEKRNINNILTNLCNRLGDLNKFKPIIDKERSAIEQELKELRHHYQTQVGDLNKYEEMRRILSSRCHLLNNISINIGRNMTDVGQVLSSIIYYTTECAKLSNLG